LAKAHTTLRTARLERDLAELDHALAVLQRERSLDPHAVVDFRGLLAIENGGDIASLGGNFVGVPLAAGRRHRVYLRVKDNCAGAIGRVLALVEDIDLVTAFGTGHLGTAAAQEDADC
jgi:hypothetical protein